MADQWDTQLNFRESPRMSMVQSNELEWIRDIAFAVIPTDHDLVGIQVTSVIEDPRVKGDQETIVRHFMYPVSGLAYLRDMIDKAISYHGEFVKAFGCKEEGD